MSTVPIDLDAPRLAEVIPFPTARLAAHTADRVRWLPGSDLRAVVDLLDGLASQHAGTGTVS